MSTPETRATILNVDDNEMTLYVRTRVLQRAGFQVIEADRGAKVMPLIATYQPDLILLDVHLPDGSGYDICRAIKSDPAYASTIVVQTSASNVDRNARLEGFAAGADSYFLEPMEPEELIANVTALLRMRRMERELRRSAIEWQKTFEAVRDGVAIVQGSGVITRCNPSFQRLTESDCVGRTVDDIFSIPLGDVRAQSFVDVELHDRNLRLAIDTVLDHMGQVTHYACILSDVTAERQIARLNEELTKTVEELRRANDIADAASRAKDEFLATLSHELRTPMTSIIGWAQMLRMFGNAQDNAEQAADAILSSARAQSQLVEDLLDLSRITTGKLRLRTDPVDLQEVVESAIQTIVPAAAAKRLTVNRHLSSATVIGDRSRLQQVVWNLLSNAVKFTPDGGQVDVTVAVRGARAVISVSDSGKGIDRAFLPAVFDRFSQAENVAGRTAGGLGLGLAIVRHIVELHGGEVTAASAGINCGSMFTVLLPISSAEVQDAGRTSDLPDLHGRRILLVEDSLETLSMFTTFLRAAGATVFPAASVKEAFVIDAAETIDAVVTDISMPGDNGLMLIRSLRSANRERIIIAITALGGGAHDEVMRAGATVLMQKPFGPADLVRKIVEL